MATSQLELFSEPDDLFTSKEPDGTAPKRRPRSLRRSKFEPTHWTQQDTKFATYVRLQETDDEIYRPSTPLPRPNTAPLPNEKTPLVLELELESSSESSSSGYHTPLNLPAMEEHVAAIIPNQQDPQAQNDGQAGNQGQNQGQAGEQQGQNQGQDGNQEQNQGQDGNQGQNQGQDGNQEQNQGQDGNQGQNQGQARQNQNQVQRGQNLQGIFSCCACLQYWLHDKWTVTNRRHFCCVCTFIAIIAVLIVILLGLVSLYLLLKNYNIHNPQPPVNLTIAPLSSIAIDLNKYNISTLWNQYINVTVSVHSEDTISGTIDVGIYKGDISCSHHQLDRECSTSNNTPFVRHWTKYTQPRGKLYCIKGNPDDKIQVYWSMAAGDSEHALPVTFNCTKGVNITELYRYITDNITDPNEIVTVKFKKEITSDGQEDKMKVNISMDECLPIPVDIPYHLIDIDDIDHNKVLSITVTVELQPFYEEILEDSLLVINTKGIQTADHIYDVIQMELIPNNSRDESYLLYIGIPILTIVILCFGVLVVHIMYVVKRRIHN